MFFSFPQTCLYSFRLRLPIRILPNWHFSKLSWYFKRFLRFQKSLSWVWNWLGSQCNWRQEAGGNICAWIPVSRKSWLCTADVVLGSPAANTCSHSESQRPYMARLTFTNLIIWHLSASLTHFSILWVFPLNDAAWFSGVTGQVWSWETSLRGSAGWMPRCFCLFSPFFFAGHSIIQPSLLLCTSTGSTVDDRLYTGWHGVLGCFHFAVSPECVSGSGRISAGDCSWVEKGTFLGSCSCVLRNTTFL